MGLLEDVKMLVYEEDEIDNKKEKDRKMNLVVLYLQHLTIMTLIIVQKKS